MEISHTIKEDIKLISIRGRMEIAIVCITPILEKYFQNSIEKDNIVNIFLDFVGNQNLADWDKNRYENNDLVSICEFIEFGEEIPKSSIFSKAPNFLLEMIYLLDEIGTSELYVSIQLFGYSSHRSLINFLNIALQNNFKIPSIEKFLQFSFLQKEGWGNCIPRAFFINA